MNMYMDDCKPIGLTMGDAAGIGPELIIKLFLHGVNTPCVVYGDGFSLQRAADVLGASSVQLQRFTDIAEFCKSESFKASVLSAGTKQNKTVLIPYIDAGVQLDERIVYGQTSALAGEAAYLFLTQAIDDALAHKIEAIVTAPLHKVSLKLAGFNYPGHTEILAERAGVEHVGMMLLNDELRVILATIHIALADVPAQITTENQRITIALAQQALALLGLPQGRIAVAGLNPHAGEEGRFGFEEEKVISPVIEQLQGEGVNVSGPYPGDTIFMRARRGEFDIVVAQYHDQGLIPVKYLGVDEGVNITVGLPFIRTSVDHGTAFDIAGQGIAEEASLRSALDLAVTMLAQRRANLAR